MAPYAWASGVSYGQHLQDNLYVRDIKGEIRKAGRGVEYQLSQQTYSMIASQDALSRAFKNGFDRANNTLNMGFDALAAELDSVTGAVETLSAAFNFGMGLILEQLSMQNRALRGILDRLDAIHDVLKNPTLTHAREFYRIGCDREEKGLLDKALEAFLDSERINDTDFWTQLRIGKLYLYGRDEDDDVCNLSEAERHLRLSVRYGKAEIGHAPELQKVVACATMHACFACFFQSQEQRNRGEDYSKQLENAGQLAAEALGFDLNLHEAKYYIAKFCSLTGHKDKALLFLTDSIRSDRNYAIKVEHDADFDPIRPLVHERLEALRTEVFDHARAEIEKARLWANDYHFQWEKEKRNLVQLTQSAERRIERGSYFDCLDALVTLDRAHLHFETLRTSKQAVTHTEWEAMEQFRPAEEERKRQERADMEKRLERRREDDRRIAAEAELNRQERARMALAAKRHGYWTTGLKMGAGFGAIAGMFYSCAGCLMPHSQLLGRNGGFNRFVASMLLCVGIGAVLGGIISYGHGRSEEI